eukprot:m.101771 g.101771  ORF g.101771 m.101771 type:complete len:475 (-) comp12586_c0_seq1:3041-4465(-)
MSNKKYTLYAKAPPARTNNFSSMSSSLGRKGRRRKEANVVVNAEDYYCFNRETKTTDDNAVYEGENKVERPSSVNSSLTIDTINTMDTAQTMSEMEQPRTMYPHATIKPFSQYVPLSFDRNGDQNTQYLNGDSRVGDSTSNILTTSSSATTTTRSITSPQRSQRKNGVDAPPSPSNNFKPHQHVTNSRKIKEEETAFPYHLSPSDNPELQHRRSGRRRAENVSISDKKNNKKKTAAPTDNDISGVDILSSHHRRTKWPLGYSADAEQQRKLLNARTLLLQWQYLCARLEYSMKKQKERAVYLIQEETLAIAKLHDEVLSLVEAEKTMRCAANTQTVMSCLEPITGTLQHQEKFLPSYRGLVKDMYVAADQLSVKNISETESESIFRAMDGCVKPLEHLSTCVGTQSMLEETSAAMEELRMTLEDSKQTSSDAAKVVNNANGLLLKQACLRFQAQHINQYQYQCNHGKVSSLFTF